MGLVGASPHIGGAHITRKGGTHGPGQPHLPQQGAP